MASPSYSDLVVELQEINKANENRREHSHGSFTTSTQEGTLAPKSMKHPNPLQITSRTNLTIKKSEDNFKRHATSWEMDVELIEQMLPLETKANHERR